MAEDKTQDMPDALSFEERVFARFDALDARLQTLEERVDERLRDTRPIWEGVQADLRRLNAKLDQVIADLFEMRTNITVLDKRVTRLEDEKRV
jgi:chromosome segregation ATPase